MFDLTDNNQSSDTTTVGTTGETFGVVTERDPVEGVKVSDKVTEPSRQTEPTKDSKVPADGQKTEANPVEPVLTEKGTKLDPNPESAAHQLAANAKRETEQLKQLLSDPQRLASYMKEAFPKKEEPAPIKPYTAEDFENLDDVATKFNELQGKFTDRLGTLETENQQLKTAVSSLLQGGKVQQIASTMEQDVNSLRKEPELDSKSPEFIEGLEEDIAEMYHKLDFDEKTGSYKGQYSIADIGKRLISATKKARKAGSEEAQTVVKDKTAGKVVTSPKVTNEPDVDKLNAGDSIALGISKTFK